MSLVCHREKIKLDEVELRSPSFDRFLFSFTSIFTILQPLGSGYHEIKVMNYPTETEHEAIGQRQRTEDHGKVIFASVFFFTLIHPTFKHAP